MPFSYSRTFQKLFKPLEPIPTGIKPILREIGPLRAVLFDLYGTLFVSGSGDVGVLRESACRQALAEALRACGNSRIDDLSREDLAHAAMDRFLAAIDDSHQKSRENGLDFPEVDIVEIWRQVLDEIGDSHGNVDARRLAVEYEARANHRSGRCRARPNASKRFAVVVCCWELSATPSSIPASFFRPY